MIDEDPVEIEQWLALNAYLCYCSAFGCFEGGVIAFQEFGIFVEGAFPAGIAFVLFALVLHALADLKVPSILIYRVWNKTRRKNDVQP